MPATPIRRAGHRGKVATISVPSVAENYKKQTWFSITQFGDSKVYVIPKKNATLRESWKWKDTMEDFVKNTFSYLEQYYLRNNSEAGFSADKRRFGWKVMQKKEERIDTAITCKNVWHNLLNLYPT